MKITKRIISIILIVSIMMSFVVVITSSADEPVEEHISCVKEHFAWVHQESIDLDITSNDFYPANNIGNCAYVSMSLLLSFYDAYWDDRFIPDEYETIGEIDTTTGEIITDFHFTLENTEWNNVITREGLISKSEAEWQQAYATLIEENWEEFFHLYLIHLGKENGFHEPDELVYGLKSYEMVDFLEFYLYEICHFSRDQVTVNIERALLPGGRTELFNKAKEHLEKGEPVIYCGYSVDLDNLDIFAKIGNIIGGHALLAQDYTENDIVLSPCWNAGSSSSAEKAALQSFNSTIYRYRTSIIWLEINPETLPHVCSDSYSQSGEGTETFCTCEIYREHPNHTDAIHTGAPICPYATTNAYCYCGEEIKGTHNYYLDNDNGLTHWKECDCGAKINEHNLTIDRGNYTSITHTMVCSSGCGYTSSRQHNLKYCISTSNSLHEGRCFCGYEGSEGHTLVPISIQLLGCTKCSYTRDRINGGNENVHLGVEDNTEEETE